MFDVILNFYNVLLRAFLLTRVGSALSILLHGFLTWSECHQAAFNPSTSYKAISKFCKKIVVGLLSTPTTQSIFWLKMKLANVEIIVILYILYLQWLCNVVKNIRLSLVEIYFRLVKDKRKLTKTNPKT